MMDGRRDVYSNVCEDFQDRKQGWMGVFEPHALLIKLCVPSRARLESDVQPAALKASLSSGRTFFFFFCLIKLPKKKNPHLSQRILSCLALTSPNLKCFQASKVHLAAFSHLPSASQHRLAKHASRLVRARLLLLCAIEKCIKSVFKNSS